MNNLLNPAIHCTDPDQLQFCLKISDEEYWYCEPNWHNDKLLPDSKSEERKHLLSYKGHPHKLIDAIKNNEEVRALLLDNQLWLNGSSEMDDFEEDEKRELLDDYGYSWDDFEDHASRNQIICEIYFEQNPLDFRSDI